MDSAWYVRDPDAFEEVRKEVEDAYPDLKFARRGSDVVLRGQYPLHEAGRVLDLFLVEVEPDRAQRRGLPVVREVGGRIPQTSERHVNRIDGTACVALPDAYWFQFPKGLSLKEFLDGPMRGYFAAQSLISRGVSDAWEGEWGHGEDGVIQFYHERFGTADPVVILGYLSLLASRTVKGHVLCPCGNGSRLRKCHGPTVTGLRSRIPREVAERSRDQLRAALSKVPGGRAN